MKILLTGAAGFIGMHLAKRLVTQGHEIIGIDNLNDYYDVNLKFSRLRELSTSEGFKFHRLDVADENGLTQLFAKEDFNTVVHLAAQAGVRYSIQNPPAYIQSNLVGFGNILECCRHNNISHLVYASSSSVYGGNSKLPFTENQGVDHPISLYAATKKSNELMAHSYSHLYKIPTTGLRFFTVYGPWGRPDMALFLFTKAILEGKPIKVFNNGRMQRDFTHINDIVESIVRILNIPPQGNQNFDSQHPNPASSRAPYRIFNIGNSKSIELLEFIEVLEKTLGRSAIKDFLSIQDGDVLSTYADTTSLSEITGFTPSTSIEAGIKDFVEWYLSYYKQAIE